MTKEQAERAIQDFPGFLEMFGFSYLYCGFLVGPQVKNISILACFVLVT